MQLTIPLLDSTGTNLADSAQTGVCLHDFESHHKV